MFIDFYTLVEGYRRIGFIQRDDDPFTFMDSNGNMMFYEPFDGELDFSFVAEDVRNYLDEETALRLVESVMDIWLQS